MQKNRYNKALAQIRFPIWPDETTGLRTAASLRYDTGDAC